jgi:hypothetical protein
VVVSVRRIANGRTRTPCSSAIAKATSALKGEHGSLCPGQRGLIDTGALGSDHHAGFVRRGHRDRHLPPDRYPRPVMANRTAAQGLYPP